ncbi:PcsB-like coiled-coil domain-containing protein, partial [Paratractidigestivibacter sp.]|uniref:PcsB-like coiled-coil domain-containing protein n=1 Tax=Paratractidigestivibacter sp. TaxID=2847316 RepID=UPI00402706A1
MKNKRTNSNIAVRAGLAAALALALAAPAAAQASTLDELQSRIDASNEAYNAAVQHATELQDKIDANQQKIQEIQAELPAKKEAAAKSLRTAYKMQTNGNDLIQLLLSSDDFNEVISTVQYLDKITSHNNAAIEELAQSSSELEQAQSALASQKAQVDSEVTNAVTALSDANNARQEYESQVAAQQP